MPTAAWLLCAFAAYPSFSSGDTSADPEAAPIAFVVRHAGEESLRDALVLGAEVWIDAGDFLVGRANLHQIEGLAKRGFAATPLHGFVEGDELFLVDLDQADVQSALGRAGRVVFRLGRQGLVALDPSVKDLPEELQPGRTCHSSHTWLRQRAAVPTRPLVVGGMVWTSSTQALGSADPRIQGLVDAVNKANIQARVVQLASNFTRISTNAAAIDTARDQIAAQLASYGYAAPVFQQFSGSHGDNVVLTIPGAVTPSQIVVLGAHYDSINGGGSSLAAPGADDNASGSASLMELARVLKTGGPLKSTLRLIWFAGEEYGLLGSDFNAQQAVTQNQDIVAMINMDMNAYRAPGDVRDCDFATNDTTASLRSFCDQMGALYVSGWASTTGVLTAGTSDHRSYFQAGFPAAFLFEDLAQYYGQIHTANDTVALATTDYDLAAMISRATLASALQLAGPVDLSIAHTELPDTTNASGPYAVTAQISSLTSATVQSAQVFYSTNGGSSFSTVPMTQSGQSWSANIPSQGSPVTITYYIHATDSQGFTETLPESAEFGGPYFDFFVGTKTPIYTTGFEEATDNGWTHGAVAGAQDDWQRNVPNGASGDPSSAFAGTRVWGNDLGPSGWNGAYANNTENWLRSPVVNCSAANNVRLEFRRWLTVESGQFDQASVRVNNQVVWQNPSTGNLVDTSWVPISLDISSIAAGNASVQVEFRLKSDGGVTFGGWNLDEFALVSVGPGSGGCPTPSAYCTAKVSSSGCVPAMGSSGTPSLASPAGFGVQTTQMESQQNGLTFFGTSGPSSTPFQDGILCVAGTLFRLNVVNSGGSSACQGSIGYTLADLLAHPSGGGLLVAGTLVNCQTWFRDPPSASTTGLSNGLEFQVCP
jgi:hypothetical protein